MTTNLKLLHRSAFDYKIKLEQQTKKSIYRLSIPTSRAQNQALDHPDALHRQPASYIPFQKWDTRPCTLYRQIALPPGYSPALASKTGCMEMPVSQDLRSTNKTL